MREVVLEGRACGACGAFVPGAPEGGAVQGERRGGTFFRDTSAALLLRVPRERSGLAYAAGYAGVLSLFRYSFEPLAHSGWWPAWALGAGLVFVLSLLAPLALALSFAAAASLDRSRGKSGALPALVGFAVGWHGSLKLLFLLDQIYCWLAPPP